MIVKNLRVLLFQLLIVFLAGSIGVHAEDVNDANIVELKQRIQTAAQKYGENSLEYAKANYNLADAYGWKGKSSKAEEYYLSALPVFELKQVESSELLVKTYLSLAHIYNESQRYDIAQTYSLKVINLLSAKNGLENTNLAHAYDLLSVAYNGQKKYAEVERVKNLLIDYYNKINELNLVLIVYKKLCNLQLAQNKFSDAEATMRKVIEIEENKLQSEDAELVIDEYVLLDDYESLAAILYKSGKFSDSENYIKKVITGFEKNYRQENLHLARAYNSLAIIYAAQSKHADADKLFQKSEQVIHRLLDVIKSESKFYLAKPQIKNYIDFLRKQNRETEADQLIKKYGN